MGMDVRGNAPLTCGVTNEGKIVPALPPSSPNNPRARLSTRLAFLVAGFGTSCWAPLVPYAKDRLAVDEQMLGILML